MAELLVCIGHAAQRQLDNTDTQCRSHTTVNISDLVGHNITYVSLNLLRRQAGAIGLYIIMLGLI